MLKVKIYKKIIAIFALFLVCVCTLAVATKVSYAGETKVYDHADVISVQNEDYLESLILEDEKKLDGCSDYIDGDNFKIVVVTDDTEGVGAEDYIDYLTSENGIVIFFSCTDGTIDAVGTGTLEEIVDERLIYAKQDAYEVLVEDPDAYVEAYDEIVSDIYDVIYFSAASSLVISYYKILGIVIVCVFAVILIVVHSQEIR